MHFVFGLGGTGIPGCFAHSCLVLQVPGVERPLVGFHDVDGGEASVMPLSEVGGDDGIRQAFLLVRTELGILQQGKLLCIQ